MSVCVSVCLCACATDINKFYGTIFKKLIRNKTAVIYNMDDVEVKFPMVTYLLKWIQKTTSYALLIL